MGLAMAELQVNRRYMEPSKLAFPCVIAGTMAAAAGTIKANAMGQQSKPVMMSALARPVHSEAFLVGTATALLHSINHRTGMAPFFVAATRTSREE